jgi:hypothetical protein
MVGTTSRWVVYRHTFPATGKSYVGQVKCTPGEAPADAMRRRWIRHVAPSELRAKAAQAFAGALLAHGRDGWAHEVLEVMSTAGGASKAERLWISRWGTLAPSGYNLTSGGEGGRAAEDLTGKRFGKLLVVRLHSTGKERSKRWLCRCDCCGQERAVESWKLRNGSATQHAVQFAPKPKRHCADCGKELPKRDGADPDVSRCRPCAMRVAWSTDSYRKAIMPSRRARFARV